MNRSIPKRTLALLWAILFLLGTSGEGFGLQPCPFHDSFQGAAEHDEGGSSHDHEHHSHHTSDEGGDSHGRHADGEPCTHIDACQTASGAILPVDIEAAVFTACLESPHAVPVPVERISAGHPPHFLPFSNAPPARG